MLISNHASFIDVVLHSGTGDTRLSTTRATYGVQVWNAQIVEVRHNAAPSVGAAEIVCGRLANVREVGRLLAEKEESNGVE